MKKILLYTLTTIIILYFVEQVVMLPYVVKTLVKLPLFVVYPLYSMKKINFRSSYKKTGIASLFVFTVIIVAFFIFRGFIDIEAIRYDMSHRMQIDKSLFILAALYTVFINAFAEEIFFRGFIFKGMLKYSRKFAYVLSALAFSIYHVAIFLTWFSLPITLLILFGLFVGGLIFNYFVEETDSILASYMIHISADIAIVLIGIHVLGFA
ncbi:CPBP family intramembrane metalloprotease [Acidaminobacter sp. JC074]|uniref:CPBP family intramembrane glutamic endopeptidase n=1 Tax=Acidaminobacter sp. JC074 TaxID=2530199 RepID=UPI001F10C409|nr:CPBP family intramembrane glutamic endopeptidase [Acidaminobacter sp. JC074]MCH4888202.1 CPBP family intramembrane metalloprotease [Acidaminobacter sp. JC074]